MKYSKKMNKEDIRLFIMEDQDSFVEGFSLYLAGTPHIKFYGSARNGSECLKKTKNKPLDIILLDLKIQENPIEGFQVAEQIIQRAKEGSPRPAIVFLSEHNNFDFISKARKLGCSFIDKYRKMALIVKDIEEIHYRKKKIFRMSEVSEDAELLKEQKDAAALLQSLLTPSEGQVVVHLPLYPRNEDIAKAITAFCLIENPKKKSKSTVDAQLRDSYVKLGLNGKENPRWILTKIVEKSGLTYYFDEINTTPSNWFGPRRNRSPW